MSPSSGRRLLVPLLLLGPASLPAQLSLDSVATRLAGVTAISGYESAMVETLRALLPASARDRAGNVVLTIGQGEPRRLIACPMDEPGYVVGGIQSDGYLTLRRVGPFPGPLADQQLEGQRVTLFGRRGPVPGVVGVRSIHLTRGRAASDAPFTLDEAYVDVGAGSGAEVSRLGVEVLSPVARTRVPVHYGDSLLAAPGAGRRTACAALVRTARTAAAVQGSVTIAFVVEHSFTRRGLLSLARLQGPFDSAILVDGTTSPDRVTRPPSPDPRVLPRYEVWGLGVRYAGSPVETVSLAEAGRLERHLIEYVGGAK